MLHYEKVSTYLPTGHVNLALYWRENRVVVYDKISHWRWLTHRPEVVAINKFYKMK